MFDLEFAPRDLVGRRIKEYLLVATCTDMTDYLPAGDGEGSAGAELRALIDGLWPEYCRHSDGFSLRAARRDRYEFLRAIGITRDAGALPR